ncbi:MAG: methyltransferase domain-containing protein [Parvularculaceae bacterium]|nr:methyltransferase domain-containing protein [Parvularculaceae bacterium]
MTKDPSRLFDPVRRRRTRSRAARDFAAHDFLHRRVFGDIVERLESTTRRFDTALLYGVGPLASMLTPKAGVGRRVAADIASERLGAGRLVFDEERSALAPRRFDLIVSLLTLHAANDLAAALAQHRAALKPDGLFIAALFAEETLGNLRRSLYAAETELYGGVSPRIAPFATLKDLGGLLQRAGFALPVADLDRIEVRYADPKRLLDDLKGMGETGFFAPPRRPLGREVLARALEEFSTRGGVERFDIAFLTGWAPHPDQQKPQKPGSARYSLEKAVREAGGPGAAD